MQKGFLRKAAFTLIMLLILVSASSALAATNSKTYTDAKITHVWKCGPVSRSSGSTKFTSGKDDNTRIVFAVSGLERYQVVELVNASNVSVSGQAEVPTGQSSGTLSVYSAYQTISSIYLQIRNPYYNDTTNWQLGRLRNAKVKKTGNGEESSHVSSFSYQDTGLLTKEIFDSGLSSGYTKV